jgi:hypothetical protein
MGKLNNGVFLKVVGDQGTRPLYEQFITEDGTDPHPQYGLAGFLETYKQLSTNIKVDLQQLADLETIILQGRSLLNLIGNVKLYTVKDKYIYARTNFYRGDIDMNEIRLLIDPIDLHFKEGDVADPEILFGNFEFMNRVYDKMRETMLATLTENVENYIKIYSNKI